MPSMQYEEALAFLQKTNSKDGSSVYEHLTRVVAKVLEEQPGAPVDLLEASLLAKITDFSAHTKESSSLVPISSAADAAKITAAASLFACSDLPIDPTTGEPVAANTPNDYECQDIAADALLFESLGVGLGVSEMYGIMLAAKRLGDDPQRGVKAVRFFGKFFGLYSDYYVFETVLKPTALPEIPAAPAGSTPVEVNAGANKFVYWVASYVGGPLTQLPYLQPEHVKTARTIKKFLTGRLDARVSTYPAFVSTEANYLRVQIARIGATTVVAPSGALSPNEDTAELEATEDWEGVPGREAAAAGAWVHRYAHLKKQGRCDVFKREAPEGEEDNPEWEPTEEEQEEEVEVLGSLEADNALGGVSADTEGALASWTPLFSSAQEHVKYQAGGLRSNLWPGAYAAAKDKQYASVYVGWGAKNAAFVPLPPPPVAAEFNLSFVETAELPPKPEPPKAEGEGEGEEEA
ncbi:hypothetical protein FOA52_003484 [Chlamydomonas sp. UWO 241]|nr:hypothetical protein FOA52_003484 [Chlamydomonas sp. UWO 241]